MSDNNPINPNISGIKLWEHGYFGGYEPLQPLIDDVTPPTDLQAFNDWFRNTVNTRLRKVHQRAVGIETAMNEIAVGTPGWAKAQLAKYANSFYKKDYIYPNPASYIYKPEFDASGVPYDFHAKFHEPAVIFPIHGVVPVNYDDFFAVVYKNGKPLGYDRFDLHRQQTGYTVFVPLSEVGSLDVITIELKKFWNALGFTEITVTDPINPVSFNITSTNLGRAYAADDGSEHSGDYIIFIKHVGDIDYDLLPRASYDVIFADHTKNNLIGTTVVPFPVGTKLIVANNSAGWEINYTVAVDTWVDEFPLICRNNPERIILSPDIDAKVKQDRYPLPVEFAEELAVFICDDSGENFKLVPNEDFIIEKNLGPDYNCQSLKLVRRVFEGTKVRIVKVEPSSWFKTFDFKPNIPRDGIIVTPQDNIMPINVDTMDVTVNNCNVGPTQLENINDRCFRIKGIGSDKDLFYRLTAVRNEVVTAILENYASFKPELERYLSLTNDYGNTSSTSFLTQYKDAHGITSLDIPDANLNDFSDYHDVGGGGLHPFNTGELGVDYIMFKTPDPSYIPEVILRGFSDNELYRFRVEVNGSMWSPNLVAGRDYSFALDNIGLNRVRILEYDTVSGTWPQNADAEVIEYMYDPSFMYPDGSSYMGIWVSEHATSIAMTEFVEANPGENFILDSNNAVQFDEQTVIGRTEYDLFPNNVPVKSSDFVESN